MSGRQNRMFKGRGTKFWKRWITKIDAPARSSGDSCGSIHRQRGKCSRSRAGKLGLKHLVKCCLEPEKNKDEKEIVDWTARERTLHRTQKGTTRIAEAMWGSVHWQVGDERDSTEQDWLPRKERRTTFHRRRKNWWNHCRLGDLNEDQDEQQQGQRTTKCHRKWNELADVHGKKTLSWWVFRNASSARWNLQVLGRWLNLSSWWNRTLSGRRRSEANWQLRWYPWCRSVSRHVSFFVWKKKGNLEIRRIYTLEDSDGISCQHLQVMTTNVLQKHREWQEEWNPSLRHGSAVTPTMYLANVDIKTISDETKPKQVAKFLDSRATRMDNCEFLLEMSGLEGKATIECVWRVILSSTDACDKGALENGHWSGQCGCRMDEERKGIP